MLLLEMRSIEKYHVCARRINLCLEPLRRIVLCIFARHVLACRLSSVTDTRVSACPSLSHIETRCTDRVRLLDRTMKNVLLVENVTCFTLYLTCFTLYSSKNHRNVNHHVMVLWLCYYPHCRVLHSLLWSYILLLFLASAISSAIGYVASM